MSEFNLWSDRMDCPKKTHVFTKTPFYLKNQHAFYPNVVSVCDITAHVSEYLGHRRQSHQRQRPFTVHTEKEID